MATRTIWSGMPKSTRTTAAAAALPDLAVRVHGKNGRMNLSSSDNVTAVLLR